MKLLGILYVLFLMNSELISINAKLSSYTYNTSKLFYNIREEDYENKRKEIDKKFKELQESYTDITFDLMPNPQNFDPLNFIVSALLTFNSNPLSDFRNLIREEIKKERPCIQKLLLDFDEQKILIAREKAEQIKSGSLSILEKSAEKFLYNEEDKLEYKKYLAENNSKEACKFYKRTIDNGSNHFIEKKKLQIEENKFIYYFLEKFKKYQIINVTTIAEEFGGMCFFDCDLRKNIIRKMRRMGAKFTDKAHFNKDYREMLESIIKDNQNQIEEINQKLLNKPKDRSGYDCDIIDQTKIDKNVELGFIGLISAALQTIRVHKKDLGTCGFDLVFTGFFMNIVAEGITALLTFVSGFFSFFAVTIILAAWKIAMVLFYAYKAYRAYKEKKMDYVSEYLGNVLGFILRLVTGKARKIKKFK
jgi:hypothetical protein